MANIKISNPPKNRTRLLAGIIVVLVIAVAFMGYYMLQQTAPSGGETITSASEAGERITSLQGQLQDIVDELKGISEEL